jgi:hypothetical protein
MDFLQVIYRGKKFSDLPLIPCKRDPAMSDPKQRNIIDSQSNKINQKNKAAAKRVGCHQKIHTNPPFNSVASQNVRINKVTE